MARVLASLGARVQLTARLPRTRRPNIARDAGMQALMAAFQDDDDELEEDM